MVFERWVGGVRPWSIQRVPVWVGFRVLTLPGVFLDFDTVDPDIDGKSGEIRRETPTRCCDASTLFHLEADSTDIYGTMQVPVMFCTMTHL